MSHLPHQLSPGNTTTVFPGCSQHSEPPKVHSKVCILDELTLFNPNIPITLEVPTSQSRARRLADSTVFCGLDYRNSFKVSRDTRLCYWNPKSATDNIKQASTQDFRESFVDNNRNQDTSGLMVLPSHPHTRSWLSLCLVTLLFKFQGPALTLMPQAISGWYFQLMTP